MSLSETLDTIRLHVMAGRVRVSEHGTRELLDDGISLAAVIAGVEKALVVEDNGTRPISPSMFFGGWPLVPRRLRQSLRATALTPTAGWTIS